MSAANTMIVKAKCNVDSHCPQKLSYFKGDSITVVDRMCNGLWTGKINSQTGLFHISTVEIPVLHKVRMQFDFLTGDSTCLKSKQGEVLSVIEVGVKMSWLYCMRGFETGYVPQNFTSVYECEETSETSTTIPETPSIFPVNAIVLHTYQPRSDKELSLVPNDQIEVFKAEKGWWYGRKGNSFGYFPGEYVEVIGNEESMVDSEAIVLFDYSSPNPNYLSAEVGDVLYVEKVVWGWAVISLDNRKFLFPLSFIAFLTETDKILNQETAITLDDFCGGSMGLLSVRQSELLVVLSNEESGMSKCQKGDQVGLVPTSNLMLIKDGQEYLVVQKTFQARNQNEMTIIANQAWIVVKVVDKNWIIGKRNGVEGFVPRSFVKVQKFQKPLRKEINEGITHIKNETENRLNGRGTAPVYQVNFFQKKPVQREKKRFFTQRKRNVKGAAGAKKEVYEEKKKSIRESLFDKPQEGKEPIQEEPIKQEPIKEEPVKQEPIQEEPVKQEEPIQEEPVKQEPVKEEPIKEEPIKEEPIKEEPVKEEPIQEEPVKEEPIQEEPIQEEPIQEEPVKQEPIQEEPIKEEPVKQEPIQEEPVKQEPIKEEPVKQEEPIQEEPTQQEDFVEEYDEEKERAFEEIEELREEIERMKRERDGLRSTLENQQEEVQQIREQHEKDILLVASLQQTITQQQNTISELTRTEEKQAKVDKEALPTLEEDEVIVELKVRVNELEQKVADEKKLRMEGAEVIKAMKASQSEGVSQVELDDFMSEVSDRVKSLESRIKILTVENEKLRKAGSGARLEQIKKDVNEKMGKYKDELTIMKRKLNVVTQSLNKS
ncbi:Meiosis-specific nuclear structural protein [Entamoeba marina]